jgi:hypothetical protein
MPILAATAEGAAQTFDISDLLTTSVSSVSTQLFTVLNIVVPAMVGVLAAVVCVKFGLRWMKRIGNA